MGLGPNRFCTRFLAGHHLAPMISLYLADEMPMNVHRGGA
jgi:hypothetical protein